MKHTLVMMEVDHHGNIAYTSDYWCLVVNGQQLCTGESISDGNYYQRFTTKERARGGITCPECLEMVREIKSVKL